MGKGRVTCSEPSDDRRSMESWFDAPMYINDPTPSQSRRVLGEAIREARRRRGLSQVALEGLAGIDQTVISRLENARPIGLRLRTFLRLLDALGVVSLEFRYQPWHPWSEGRPPYPGHVAAVETSADVSMSATADVPSARVPS
ncbi:MAG: helix-turn-helix domain-containing protein [Candidatus Limnocylindrales bacterium]